MRQPRTIRAYLLSAILLGAILPLAVVGAWLTRGGVRAGEALLRSQLDTSLANVQRSMGRRWELRRGDLLMLADAPAAQRILAGTMTAADSGFLDQAEGAIDRGIVSFEYVDRAGRVRWSGDPNTLRNTGSQPPRVAANGASFAASLPIVDSAGAIAGALRAKIRLSGILPTDSSRLLLPGSQLGVRDRTNGEVLASVLDDAPFSTGAVARSAGGEWMIVTRQMSEPPLDIALAALSTPYVAPFAHAATAGLGALLVVALIALIITFYMTSRLSRAMNTLVDATDAVARGDLANAIETRGPAELQRLARGFNVMTENLRRVLSELAQRRALAAIGEFAASLSHEVRNTLTPVQVDLERAEERLADDERTRALVVRALSQVRRLEGSVAGALAIARSGRVAHRRIDLQEVLRTAGDRASTAFRATESALIVPDDSSPLWVDGDPDALCHLFLNLFLNAGQALGAGGRAVVCASRGDRVVTVAINDDGRGIARDDLRRIPEAFFSTREGGTGLGLPIAQQIAAAHRGTLAVESHEGLGTVVRVELPMFGLA
jgi:signal transduction histidine kinase